MLKNVFLVLKVNHHNVQVFVVTIKHSCGFSCTEIYSKENTSKTY